MRKIIAALVISMTASFSFANCVGSSSSYSCNDSSGNNYNVQKYGNSTNVQGSNAATGSTWSQNSQTYGNTTQIQGNSNGRSWNETVQTSPGMTTYSGTNSQGQSYLKTCTKYGCN